MCIKESIGTKKNKKVVHLSSKSDNKEKDKTPEALVHPNKVWKKDRDMEEYGDFCLKDANPDIFCLARDKDAALADYFSGSVFWNISLTRPYIGKRSFYFTL